MKSQNDSYYATTTARLLSDTPINKSALSPPAVNLKADKWGLAASLVVQLQMNSCVLESNIHAMEMGLMGSLEHNRSLKLMEKIYHIIDWSKIESLLMNHYTVGTSSEGADAYPFPELHHVFLVA